MAYPILTDDLDARLLKMKDFGEDCHHQGYRRFE
jgi:hypothetical protein